MAGRVLKDSGTFTLRKEGGGVAGHDLVGKNGLENTQVVLTGVTPGGESKVASRAGQTGPNWYEPGDNYYAQPPRRRGFFARLFGGPYYNGPQGYYGPPPAYYPPRGY
jgi:hypothetical protein